MKKRKKPILLIAVLAACGAVAIGMNGLQSGLFRLPQPGAPTNATSAPRENTTTAETVAANSKGAVDALKKAPDASNQAAANFRKTLGGKPLMAVPKPTAVKQMPNEASTSTQWYRDNTYTAEKAGN